MLQLVAEKTGAVIEVRPEAGRNTSLNTLAGTSKRCAGAIAQRFSLQFHHREFAATSNQPAQVLSTLRGADTPILPPQLSADQTSKALLPNRRCSAPLHLCACRIVPRSGPPSPQQPGNGSLQPPTDPIPQCLTERRKIGFGAGKRTIPKAATTTIGLLRKVAPQYMAGWGTTP